MDLKKLLHNAALVLLPTASFSQSDVSFARQAREPVVIDGKSVEWQKPFNFYDKSTNLYFSISNDTSNLYLCFETSSPLNQLRILKSGLTISINSKSKSKQTGIIKYPQKDTHLTKENLNVGVEMLQLKSDYERKKNVITTEGFLFSNGTLDNNPASICGLINWDNDNVMSIEFKIPMRELFGNDYNVQKSKDVLTLKLEINGYPQNQIKSVAVNPNISGRSLTNPAQNMGLNQANPMNPMLQPNQQDPPMNQDDIDANSITEVSEFNVLFQKSELKQRFFLFTEF